MSIPVHSLLVTMGGGGYGWTCPCGRRGRGETYPGWTHADARQAAERQHDRKISSEEEGDMSRELRIVAVCSLCGHEYERWFDEAAYAAHMADVHGMYFDPRPLRRPGPAA